MRNLRLKQAHETKLVAYLSARLPGLDQDNRERIDADRKSDLAYENSREARAKEGGVFAQSNMPVPLTSTVVDHFGARTEEEVFGRKPFAQFGPEGPADQDSARGFDRFAQYKLFKRGRVDKDLLESSHSLFRHRAQFLKAIYEEDVDTWEEHDVPVLHSSKDQQPVLILNHGYVIEGRDKWIEAVNGATGRPVMVLEIDPTVELDPTDPTAYYFRPLKKAIRFKDVHYAGPRSREVDSDCIRIPSDARSVDEADIIVEYYDKPSHWVKSRFLDREWMKWADFEKRLRSERADRKTEDERKKASSENKAFDMDSASFGIAEIWLERDILGWGTPQRVVLWYDKKSKTLIDYEFQKKVTPNGRHPYTVTAIAKTKQYWWGKSIPELLQPFQDYIDLQWNRHSFRNSINANPILGQHPDAIVEKKSFYEIAPFDVMTFEHGKTMKDWLEAFVFPNADLDTQDLIDKAIYWVNFWLGISNIARGDYSDVPQNTTLGGQESALKEASKLSKRWSRRSIVGYEDHLTKLAEIMLATMDEEEVYTYLEGDTTQMGFITKDSVRDYIVNAKLIIGSEDTTASLQKDQLTLTTIKEYMAFAAVPQMQAIIRPVMKSILFKLGHDDVDALLPIPMVPGIGPNGEAIMVPATANMPPAPTAAPGAESQVPPQDPSKVVPFNEQAPATPTAAANGG
jgi:hypothetical protein